MTAADKFAPLRKGLLEFLVLRIVAAHKVYAADILGRLEATDFATGEGTLYPLLSRLRRENLLDYEWVESEAGPPRKYYRLTLQGQGQLQELQAYWQSINATIEAIASDVGYGGRGGDGGDAENLAGESGGRAGGETSGGAAATMNITDEADSKGDES